MRWPDTDGKPVCPKCGHTESYEIKARRKYECTACRHQFSATSGTIFASRKGLSASSVWRWHILLAGCGKAIGNEQLPLELRHEPRNPQVPPALLTQVTAFGRERAMHDLYPLRLQKVGNRNEVSVS